VALANGQYPATLGRRALWLPPALRPQIERAVRQERPHGSHAWKNMPLENRGELRSGACSEPVDTRDASIGGFTHASARHRGSDTGPRTGGVRQARPRACRLAPLAELPVDMAGLRSLATARINDTEVQPRSSSCGCSEPPPPCSCGSIRCSRRSASVPDTSARAGRRERPPAHSSQRCRSTTPLFLPVYLPSASSIVPLTIT
jgi:hypothetical protein